MGLLSIKDNRPILDNGHLRWDPGCGNARFGMGRFYIDGVLIGGGEGAFLTEENTFSSYFCDSYEILEDTKDCAAIRFKSYNGRIRLTVDAVMKKGVPAVAFKMSIDPELPVLHRLYANGPFDLDHSDFVKFPFEDTVMQEGKGHRMSIEPSVATVPMVFGREIIEDKKYYLGIGYDLRDEFTDGRLVYEPCDTAYPFKLYNTQKVIQRNSDMQLSWRNDCLREIDFEPQIAKSVRTLRFDVFAGISQFEALKAHMDSCGYDLNVTMRRSADECLDETFATLRDIKAYVPGKGYHLLARTDTGRFDNTIVRGGYGTMIPASSDVCLAHCFYDYYLHNKNEEWAKTRAFEMANFFCAAQLPNGAVVMHDTDSGKADKAHPEKATAEFFGGFYILLFDVANGARNLLELYKLVNEKEGSAPKTWEEAALKAAEYIVSLVGEDGKIGRNYNFSGQYDNVCAADSDVMASLEVFYRYTGDARFDEARARIEKWAWNDIIDYDLWMNDSNDSGNWDGSAASLGNNDSMFIPNFISYCALMHKDTGESRYLDMAKDALMYEWACAVPIQMKGYKHYTRMLKMEQQFYTNFDPPLMIQDQAIGYQYLAKEADEPVFMELLRIILQTQIDMQERDDPYKGIHLGLDCDENTLTPLDRFGEGKQIYCAMPKLIYDIARGPESLSYVGGRGWGLGLDYQLPFDVKAIVGKPYVKSCTSMLRDESYDESSKTMRYWIYDQRRNEANIEIVWDTDLDPKNATVYYNDTKATASGLIKDGILHLHLIGDGSPSKIVQIIF